MARRSWRPALFCEGHVVDGGFDGSVRFCSSRRNLCLAFRARWVWRSAHFITKLIDDLEFEDSDSNEDEKKQQTAEDDSLSQNNSDEENNPKSENEKNQQAEAEFNVIDGNTDFSDENENSTQGKTEKPTSDLTFQKINLKKLSRDRYKIFTSEYDEVKKAEEIEKEEETTQNGEV